MHALMNKCRICGNQKNNQSWFFKEMMSGTREDFEYFQCSQCECLQIKEYLKNVNQYYGNNYYSLRPLTIVEHSIRQQLVRLRDRFECTGRGVLGRLLSYARPNLYLRNLNLRQLNFNSEILDIGCGSGSQLYKLREVGFYNLTGVDPNIKSSVFENGVRLIKGEVKDLESTYDWVLVSHSLEHMPDQLKCLQDFYEILKKDGLLIIRLPIVSSFAWQHYKSDWYQIDAPRHFYLHSYKSFSLIAEKSGYSILTILNDSNEDQFLISDSYRKGIPMCEFKLTTPDKKLVKKYSKLANELNQKQQGDKAVFVLKKCK